MLPPTCKDTILQQHKSRRENPSSHCCPCHQAGANPFLSASTSPEPLVAPAGQHTAESQHQKPETAEQSPAALERQSPWENSPPQSMEHTRAPMQQQQHSSCQRLQMETSSSLRDSPFHAPGCRRNLSPEGQGLGEDVLGLSRPPQSSHCGENTMESPQSTWARRGLGESSGFDVLRRSRLWGPLTLGALPSVSFFPWSPCKMGPSTDVGKLGTRCQDAWGPIQAYLPSPPGILQAAAFLC